MKLEAARSIQTDDCRGPCLAKLLLRPVWRTDCRKPAVKEGRPCCCLRARAEAVMVEEEMLGRM